MVVVRTEEIVESIRIIAALSLPRLRMVPDVPVEYKNVNLNEHDSD